MLFHFLMTVLIQNHLENQCNHPINLTVVVYIQVKKKKVKKPNLKMY